MAEHEPVIAPDQKKPGHRKGGQIGAVVVAISLVLMQFCNNEVTGVERIWLNGLAAALILAVIGDAVLRRIGLRSSS